MSSQGRLLWTNCAYISLIKPTRGHPFKTSAFFRGEGVKTWPNLPTDSNKKLSTEGGRGQKSWKFADVLNGWSLTKCDPTQIFGLLLNRCPNWTFTRQYCIMHRLRHSIAGYVSNSSVSKRFNVKLQKIVILP